MSTRIPSILVTVSLPGPVSIPFTGWTGSKRLGSQRSTGCPSRSVFCWSRSCATWMAKKSRNRMCSTWPAGSRAAERPSMPFYPGRVVMQDFTGVPVVVDLAAMRSALARLGGDPQKINPTVPVDLVIDHSVQVDYFGNRGCPALECRPGIRTQPRALRVPALGPESLR